MLSRRRSLRSYRVGHSDNSLPCMVSVWMFGEGVVPRALVSTAGGI